VTEKEMNLRINNDLHVEEVLLNHSFHCTHAHPQVVGVEYPNIIPAAHHFKHEILFNATSTLTAATTQCNNKAIY